jgi:hypothetical protein
MSTDENKKASSFFWRMFYLRLLLCAILFPIVGTSIVDMATGRSSPIDFSDPVLIAVSTVTCAFIVGFFVAFVFAETALRPFALLYFHLLDLLFLPLCGFVVDLFLTPRMWFARLMDAAHYRGVDETKRPKYTLTIGRANVELVLFATMFLISLAVWHLLFRDLVMPADQ